MDGLWIVGMGKERRVEDGWEGGRKEGRKG
jgi:hypothetical protein